MNQNRKENFSIWEPFKYPIFRMLWITSVLSNIGTWMHEVGAAWLMTTLTPNFLLVALVQATTALSVCLLALPAGALADILDKRRYLIILQCWMMMIATVLALLSFLGKISPELLLTFTFLLGMGTALNAPTWQATVPELVPPKDIYLAVMFNSLGVNLSRAIGPVLAGVTITMIGPWAVFSLNAVSFFGVIIALLYWHREPKENTLPAERMFGAMRAGIRYIKGAPALQRVLLKSSAFFVFASAAWALLPLIARVQLQSGSTGYGILLAMLGSGAVLGGFSLRRISYILNSDQRIFFSAFSFTLTLFTLSFFKNFYFACAALFLGGFAWITVISTLNTTAQQSVPSWVRARAMSSYLMIYFFGMAIGSVLWGWVAGHFSISIALCISGAGLIIANLFTYRLSLEGIQKLDHTPTFDSPAPLGVQSPRHEQGPVMITVEYKVKQQNINKFSDAIGNLRIIRLREGAFFWTLFQDIDNPTRFVECFMVESWLEHLRFHERVSISDRKAQLAVSAFHEGDKRPQVTHFVAHEFGKKRIKLF